jgi:hypothetical protein
MYDTRQKGLKGVENLDLTGAALELLACLLAEGLTGLL